MLPTFILIEILSFFYISYGFTRHTTFRRFFCKSRDRNILQEENNFRLNSGLDFVEIPLAEVQQNISLYLNISLENVGIVALDEGETNHCYRCYDNSLGLSDTNSKQVFVKHAKSYKKGQKNKLLSPSRLEYDCYGMKAFARYTPDLVPAVLAYDKENHVLVLEYLINHSPLKELFKNGNVPQETATMIGTLMGRNHARTYWSAIPSYQRERYQSVFANEEHISHWNRDMFLPTIEFFKGLMDQDPTEKVEAIYDDNVDIKMQWTGSDVASKTKGYKDTILVAINSLQQKHLYKKETLIHGDLHCGNILYSLDSYDSDRLQLKVVDFEKCCYGPAGLDLGLYLANYLWYYIVHSNSITRQRFFNQIFSFIESYIAAYKVQMAGTIKSNLFKTRPIDVDKGGEKSDDELSSLNPDEILSNIVSDAIGFSALHICFLTFTAPESRMLDIEGIPEFDWGDAKGRRLSFERRRVHMINKLFQIYNQFDSRISGNLISKLVNQLENALRSDDALLASDHFTEFWF